MHCTTDWFSNQRGERGCGTPRGTARTKFKFLLTKKWSVAAGPRGEDLSLRSPLCFLTQCSKHQQKAHEPFTHTQIDNISQDISFKKNFLDQTEKL